MIRTRRFSSGILKTFWKRLEALDHEAAVRGAEHVDPPSLRFDLGPGRLAHRVHPHGEGVGHLALAEDLHPPAVRPPDQPRLHQAVGIDHAARREGVEVAQVHHGVRVLAAVGHETALRQPAIEGHLASLEAGALATSRAGLLALVPLGRGLAVAGARAASDHLAAVLGPGGRAKILKPHASPGARATTLATIPRTVAESSCVHRVVHAPEAQGLDRGLLLRAEPDHALREGDPKRLCH